MAAMHLVTCGLGIVLAALGTQQFVHGLIDLAWLASSRAPDNRMVALSAALRSGSLTNWLNDSGR
jgi:hypothetical protein